MKVGQVSKLRDKKVCCGHPQHSIRKGCPLAGSWGDFSWEVHFPAICHPLEDDFTWDDCCEHLQIVEEG